MTTTTMITNGRVDADEDGWTRIEADGLVLKIKITVTPPAPPPPTHQHCDHCTQPARPRWVLPTDRERQYYDSLPKFYPVPTVRETVWEAL